MMLTTGIPLIGNFHGLLVFKDDDELHKIEDAVHRMVKRALAMDGTCTGEHGVGLGKKEYLRDELGEGTIELMRRIKGDSNDTTEIRYS